ncbi:hypothetical protein ACFYT4_07330 [Streptomyces sp. NPDC004609]|uniref:hypothetical protein n=1 Tax=Streptomyces sp. NPDC004609 TaxID=3364704 RepID=UPI0036AEA299
MTRDALTCEPPADSSATCCVCGRWTLAPLPVRRVARPSGAPMTVHACPEHAQTLVPAPVPGELDGDT